MLSNPTTPTLVAATEQARLDALRELRAARDLMGRWTDFVRRQAHARVGSDDFDDVLADPAYWAAIELYGEVNDAIAGFALHGDRLPGGDQ